MCDNSQFAGAGEIEVFSTFEDNLSEALPQDTCDWKRSLGRPVRPVRIGATFIPYNSVALPKGNQWDLIRQPLFHIYWTDCSVCHFINISFQNIKLFLFLIGC